MDKEKIEKAREFLRALDEKAKSEYSQTILRNALIREKLSEIKMPS